MESHIANIGGIFLQSAKAEKLAAWYSENFGLEWEYFEEYKVHYLVYKYNELDSGNEAYIVFSILGDDKRPEMKDKFFTLNLRVRDIDLLHKELKEKGIDVSDIEDSPQGKFAHLNDIDGNFLELWQDTAIGKI